MDGMVLSVKLLDVSEENSGQFPAEFLATKARYFNQNLRRSLAVFVKTKRGISTQENDVFLNLTKWVLNPNFTRALTQHCHKTKLNN